MPSQEAKQTYVTSGSGPRAPLDRVRDFSPQLALFDTLGSSVSEATLFNFRMGEGNAVPGHNAQRRRMSQAVPTKIGFCVLEDNYKTTH